MADNYWNRLAGLAAPQSVSEKAKADAEAAAEARNGAILERRFDRVRKWALSQSKSEIADDLALLFLECMFERQSHRLYKSLSESTSESLARAHVEIDVQRETRNEVFREVQPILDRVRKALADRRKSRAGRMPRLNAWLDDRDVFATNEDLFNALPESESESAGNLYRERDRVWEHYDNGKSHSVGRPGFDKHVTKARARAKKRR